MIPKIILNSLIAHKIVAGATVAVLIGVGGGVAIHVSRQDNAAAPDTTTSAQSSGQNGAARPGAASANPVATDPSQPPSQNTSDTQKTTPGKNTTGSTSPASTGTGTQSGGGTVSGGGTSGGGTGGTSGGTTNTPPTAPTNAHVGSLQTTSVRIDANRATDSDGILRHELLRNGSLIATSTSTAAVVAIIDSGVTAGQTYTYTMRAVDTLGATGALSNSVTVTVPVPDTTPPSVPTNFRVTANTPSGVTLAWDPSTDNVDTAGDIWYIITSPLDESVFYTWTQTNPYTAISFDSGITYQVYIQAIDSAGNESAKAGPVTFTAQ